MNLQPVSKYPIFCASCVRCLTPTMADAKTGLFADLDGEHFKAYYCGACAQDVRAAQFADAYRVKQSDDDWAYAARAELAHPVSIESAWGRVSFHMERLFRSAGGRGPYAHADFLAAAYAMGLPEQIEGVYTRAQCVLALKLIESAARGQGMHHFRDCATHPEQIA